MEHLLLLGWGGKGVGVGVGVEGETEEAPQACSNLVIGHAKCEAPLCLKSVL